MAVQHSTEPAIGLANFWGQSCWHSREPGLRFVGALRCTVIPSLANRQQAITLHDRGDLTCALDEGHRIKAPRVPALPSDSGRTHRCALLAMPVKREGLSR